MNMDLNRLYHQKRRELFIPLSFRVSVQLEQMDWQEFVEDPVYATFALRNGQKLFKADGVINWFDTYLEAEALGIEVVRDNTGNVLSHSPDTLSLSDSKTFLQQGQIPHVLDVTERLCKETNQQSVVLGCLSGMQTFLRHVLGSDKHQALTQGLMSKADQEFVKDTVQYTLQLAKSYCELGVGCIVMAEEEKTDVALLKFLEPVMNMSRYYGVPMLLLHLQPITPEEKLSLQSVFQYVVAGSDSSEDAKDKFSILPTSLVTQEDYSWESWLQDKSRKSENQFFITDWELPLQTVSENILAFRDLLDAKNRH